MLSSWKIDGSLSAFFTTFCFYRSFLWFVVISHILYQVLIFEEEQSEHVAWKVKIELLTSFFYYISYCYFTLYIRLNQIIRIETL